MFKNERTLMWEKQKWGGDVKKLILREGCLIRSEDGCIFILNEWSHWQDEDREVT